MVYLIDHQKYIFSREDGRKLTAPFGFRCVTAGSRAHRAGAQGGGGLFDPTPQAVLSDNLCTYKSVINSMNCLQLDFFLQNTHAA